MSNQITYQRRKIMWKSHTKFVDKQTGEEISRWNAETNYIIIKTSKHVTFNYNKTKAMVEYTTECQKDLKLFQD